MCFLFCLSLFLGVVVLMFFLCFRYYLLNKIFRLFIKLVRFWVRRCGYVVFKKFYLQFFLLFTMSRSCKVIRCVLMGKWRAFGGFGQGMIYKQDTKNMRDWVIELKDGIRVQVGNLQYRRVWEFIIYRIGFLGKVVFFLVQKLNIFYVVIFCLFWRIVFGFIFQNIEEESKVFLVRRN